MDIQHIIWRTFDEEMPTEYSAILVRGEMKDNGHASEFYVFIIENGALTHAESGKPINQLENFKDYTFTHWAYIQGPSL